MIIYKAQVVNNLKDVSDIIRQELGYELADFLEEQVQGVTADYDQLELQLQNEERAHELHCEEWMNVVRDARDALDEVLFDVEHEMFDSFKVPKKRLNRKALEKILEDLDNAL